MPGRHVPRQFALAVVVVAFIVFAGACGGTSQPEGFREGRSIYGDVCSVCHGSSGQGGVGPPLDEVTRTWPSCDDQVEWITLGSDGWRSEHGDVYGATRKPVAGGMPPHGDSLSLSQIRAVAAFERAQYGGQDTATALQECNAG